MTTIKVWLRDVGPRFEVRSEMVRACAKELGVSEKSVRNYVVGVLGEVAVVGGTKRRKKRKKVKVLEKGKFLESVDCVGKVVRFLDKVVGENYIEEEKLRRKFEISQVRWRELLRLKVFEGRRISVEQEGRKVTVWSTRKGIEELRDTVNMSRWEESDGIRYN